MSTRTIRTIHVQSSSSTSIVLLPSSHYDSQSQQYQLEHPPMSAAASPMPCCFILLLVLLISSLFLPTPYLHVSAVDVLNNSTDTNTTSNGNNTIGTNTTSNSNTTTSNTTDAIPTTIHAPAPVIETPFLTTFTTTAPLTGQVRIRMIWTLDTLPSGVLLASASSSSSSNTSNTTSTSDPPLISSFLSTLSSELVTVFSDIRTQDPDISLESITALPFTVENVLSLTPFYGSPAYTPADKHITVYTQLEDMTKLQFDAKRMFVEMRNQRLDDGSVLMKHTVLLAKLQSFVQLCNQTSVGLEWTTQCGTDPIPFIKAANTRYAQYTGLAVLICQTILFAIVFQIYRFKTCDPSTLEAPNWNYPAAATNAAASPTAAMIGPSKMMKIQVQASPTNAGLSGGPANNQFLFSPNQFLFTPSPKGSPVNNNNNNNGGAAGMHNRWGSTSTQNSNSSVGLRVNTNFAPANNNSRLIVPQSNQQQQQGQQYQRQPSQPALDGYDRSGMDDEMNEDSYVEVMNVNTNNNNNNNLNLNKPSPISPATGAASTVVAPPASPRSPNNLTMNSPSPAAVGSPTTPRAANSQGTLTTSPSFIKVQRTPTNTNAQVTQQPQQQIQSSPAPSPRSPSLTINTSVPPTNTVSTANMIVASPRVVSNAAATSTTPPNTNFTPIPAASPRTKSSVDAAPSTLTQQQMSATTVASLAATLVRPPPRPIQIVPPAAMAKIMSRHDLNGSKV